jgi:branched-chain amino acid transport system permease protein
MDAGLARLLAGRAAAGTLLLGGVVLATEMAYQLSLGSLADSGEGMAPVRLFGLDFDVHSVAAWGLSAALCAAGVAAIARWRAPWSAAWSRAWKRVEAAEQAGRESGAP